MLFKMLLIFGVLICCSTVFSQKENGEKHYMGIDVGFDPFSLLKVALESKFNLDEDNYNDDDEERYGIMVLGTYYKYKPFNKIDFDAGYKFMISSLGDLKRSDDTFDYDYISGVDHLLYTRMNYNLANVHEDGEGHISFAIGAGCIWTPGKVSILNRKTGLLDSEKIRGTSPFYEFKVGYKYGWSNSAIGINFAINNAPYQKAVLEDIESRGFSNEVSGGIGIVIGIDYEFSFKRNKTKVQQIKRKKKNRAIIEKYAINQEGI